MSWLRAKPFVDGVEIESFPHSGGGEVTVQFEEDRREWRIGDQVEVTPSDCQAIAMSLSLLGKRLLADFEREMDEGLDLSGRAESDTS